MINITINSKEERLEKEMDVMTFLSKKGIKKDSVVVLINEDVIKKDDFERVMIKDGNKIEILRFVSGG